MRKYSFQRSKDDKEKKWLEVSHYGFTLRKVSDHGNNYILESIKYYDGMQRELIDFSAKNEEAAEEKAINLIVKIMNEEIKWKEVLVSRLKKDVMNIIDSEMKRLNK